jgi:hypothetical protein
MLTASFRLPSEQTVNACQTELNHFSRDKKSVLIVEKDYERFSLHRIDGPTNVQIPINEPFIRELPSNTSQSVDREIYIIEPEPAESTDVAAVLIMVFVSDSRGNAIGALSEPSTPRRYINMLVYLSTQGGDSKLPIDMAFDLLQNLGQADKWSCSEAHLIDRTVSFLRKRKAHLSTYKTLASPGTMTVSLRDVPTAKVSARFEW